MAIQTKPSPTPPAHLLGVLRSLWQWKMPIIYVTIAGTLLAVVISLLLPEYFTASTTFLTISPDQNSIDGVFGNKNSRMQFYGSGDDIDRTMAVAESDALIDFMVKEFNLYDVYEIDSTKVKAPVYVRSEFMGNYEVKKNARDAIEMSVSDKDPVRAAEMARAARVKVDQISLSLIRNTQGRSASGLRTEIQTTETNLVDINNSIRALRKKSGVYNTDAQSEALATMTTSLQNSIASTEAKMKTYRRKGGRGSRDSIAKYEVQLAGYASARINLDSQLVLLNESLGPIDNLEEERQRLNDALSRNRIRLKQFETVLTSDQKAVEVVEEAKVPVIKSYPVRSLIVVGAAILSFIFAVVGALIIDTGKKYDWGEVFE